MTTEEQNEIHQIAKNLQFVLESSYTHEPLGKVEMHMLGHAIGRMESLLGNDLYADGSLYDNDDEDILGFGQDDDPSLYDQHINEQ